MTELADAYRQALQTMLDAARATDSDVALGANVLQALLDENNRLRADRGALLSAMKRILHIIDQGGKYKITVDQICTYAHSVVVLHDRNRGA